MAKVGKAGSRKRRKGVDGVAASPDRWHPYLGNQVLAERAWFLVSASRAGLGLVRRGGGAVTGTLLRCYKSL